MREDVVKKLPTLFCHKKLRERERERERERRRESDLKFRRRRHGNLGRHNKAVDERKGRPGRPTHIV